MTITLLPSSTQPQLSVSSAQQSLTVSSQQVVIDASDETSLSLSVTTAAVSLSVHAEPTVELSAVTSPSPISLVVGSQGPAGPPGSGGGGSSTESVVAGESVSALKPAVIIDGAAFVGRNTNAAHRGFVAGVFVTAGDSGDTVTIQVSGQLQDSSWNWDTTKPWLFYGDGVLTQTPPSEWCQAIARVEESDTIFINILSGIER